MRMSGAMVVRRNPIDGEVAVVGASASQRRAVPSITARAITRLDHAPAINMIIDLPQLFRLHEGVEADMTRPLAPIAPQSEASHARPPRKTRGPRAAAGAAERAGVQWHGWRG
jgi:hypothetical protein